MRYVGLVIAIIIALDLAFLAVMIGIHSTTNYN